jgi:hypothetical protein
MSRSSAANEFRRRMADPMTALKRGRSGSDGRFHGIAWICSGPSFASASVVSRRAATSIPPTRQRAPATWQPVAHRIEFCALRHPGGTPDQWRLFGEAALSVSEWPRPSLLNSGNFRSALADDARNTPCSPESGSLEHYQTAFEPLLYGVVIAIFLILLLRETGPAVRPAVPAVAGETP